MEKILCIIFGILCMLGVISGIIDSICPAKDGMYQLKEGEVWDES